MIMSIGTTFNYEIPLHDQLPMIREAGFTHVSLGGADLNHSRYLDRHGQKLLKRLLADSNLKVCSLHAPFKDGFDISSIERDIAAKTSDMLKRCIDAALLLKANALIFHPGPPCVGQVKDRREVLVRQVLALLEHVGKANLKLAIENLSNDSANRVTAFSFQRIANSKYGLCYDTSHDNLVATPLAILERFKDRLITTHIADNRGMRDDHMLPFEGYFRWDKFCRVFSGVNFDGIFLLEVEMRLSAFSKPQQFLSEAFLRGARLLRDAGKA